jgi:hypothetical protein
MSFLRIIRATVAVVVVLPFAFIAGLVSKGRKSTPEEFAALLHRLANGTEGERDWDELESVPLRDSRLEALRQEAIRVPQDDRARLSLLATKASHLPSQ